MAISGSSGGMSRVLLKKAASIVTATSFLAAAVFFVGVLWLPANAASPSTEVEVQPSLLLALDTPQAPAAKVRVASLADEVREVGDIASPDLASELNGWTYTQGNFTDQIIQYNMAQYQLIYRNELNNLYTEVALLRNTALLYQTLLTDLGFPVPGSLTNLINGLTYIENGLSPYR